MTIHAGGLLTLIRARYPGPEWAVLDELHDGTGAAANRRFDAVAFNCWPSRGFVRLGFEIKVSRGDFARELGDHAKRAALEQHQAGEGLEETVKTGAGGRVQAGHDPARPPARRCPNIQRAPSHLRPVP